jgi:hypothetical protein
MHAIARQPSWTNRKILYCTVHFIVQALVAGVSVLILLSQAAGLLGPIETFNHNSPEM